MNNNHFKDHYPPGTTQDYKGHYPPGPGTTQDYKGHYPPGPGTTQDYKGHYPPGPGTTRDYKGHYPPGPGTTRDYKGHYPPGTTRDYKVQCFQVYYITGLYNYMFTDILDLWIMSLPDYQIYNITFIIMNLL